jgi:hypothetical protein
MRMPFGKSKPVNRKPTFCAKSVKRIKDEVTYCIQYYKPNFISTLCPTTSQSHLVMVAKLLLLVLGGDFAVAFSSLSNMYCSKSCK